ncbi:MAG TPA: YfiR family protein [Thermoanaerobaculia bacterium]|nr:YfiR family protein [Thermoanaerobaculia bacterium]
MAAPAAAAEARVAEQRALQATFLYHFTKFVEWPDAAFDSPDTPFRLCVVGDDPFGDLLDRVVRGERAAGRPIEVERHPLPGSARGCQIVYLPDALDSELVGGLPGFDEGLVLTVGETAAFLRQGGMLRFLEREGRIALAVNEQARRRSRLHVSSKLLQLSQRVRPEPEAGQGD